MSAGITILLIVFAYVIIVFGLSQLFIPFLRREPLPKTIPAKIKADIYILERKSKSSEQFAKLVYKHILSTKRCGRFATVINLKQAFSRDINKLYDRNGFMHCTHLNHLTRIMLANSKFFKDSDIKLRITSINFNIHQYLQIKINNKWIDVDPGGAWMGAQFGEHAWGLR